MCFAGNMYFTESISQLVQSVCELQGADKHSLERDVDVRYVRSLLLLSRLAFI